jgi:uncharacterized UBP type Zn finger protein
MGSSAIMMWAPSQPARATISSHHSRTSDYERDKMPTCTHLSQVKITQLPASVDGCVDCLASGGKWLHLRICLECGHVACCDDSPNRHATAHAEGSGHPIVRSLEPGEEWSWCYVDQHGTTRIPPSPLLTQGW